MEELSKMEYISSNIPNEDDYPDFSDFNDWFKELYERIAPDLIVGIARGAIRLLQLHDVEGSIAKVPIISNFALPFLPVEEIRNKRILVFDDSLIYGSQMDAVRKYLLQRAAIPFCAAYVVDRKNFYGETREKGDQEVGESKYITIPLEKKKKLWPSEIRVHHNVLVRRLLNTPEHYNLDFPTYIIQCDEFGQENTTAIIEILKKVIGDDRIYNVTSEDAAISNIFRYSAMFKFSCDGIVSTDKVKIRPFCKARITVSPSFGQIRITPIVQLLIHDSIDVNQKIFSDEAIQNLWQSLQLPSPNDKYFKSSLFRLLTAFITTLASKWLIEEFVRKLGWRLRVKNIELVEHDMRVILGSINSERLREIYESIPPIQYINVQTLNDEKDREKVVEPVNVELVDLISSAWKTSPPYKPYQSDLPYEMLAKIFLTMRNVTDNPTVREKNPSLSRIEVGLSFGALKKLLIEDCGITINDDDLSTAVDVCVDNGQAVPKVLQLDSYWHRIFYSGEDAGYIDPMLLKKNYSHQAYTEFLKTNKSLLLSPFEYHKLGVTLKNVYSWIPTTNKNSFYGKISIVNQAERDLVAWMTEGANPPLLKDSEKKRAELYPNPEYRHAPESAWPPKRIEDFLNGFQYIAMAYGKLRSPHKILMSTCNTHRDAYNAVAFEAHSWVIKGFYNYRELLDSALVDDEGKLIEGGYLVNNIYWCCRYISEAFFKYDVFHRQFAGLKEKIGEVFGLQGNQAKHFWDLTLKESLKPDRIPDIDSRFKRLMPVVDQMKTLTAYTIRLLNAMGYISYEEIKNMARYEGLEDVDILFGWLLKKDIVECAVEYNKTINSSALFGTSIWKTLLPEEELSANHKNRLSQYKSFHTVLEKCFDEIRMVVNEYFREYKTSNGVSTFAPERAVISHDDGSVERIMENMYILAMDIIGSTNSPQTNEVKQACFQTFEQFRAHKRNVYFECTGNDEYIVCADEPSVLLDIAEAIRILKNDFVQPGSKFGGTRKALGFGTLRIVQTGESNFRIQDDAAPNLIPQVTSFLKSLKDAEGKTKSDPNDLVIIDQYSIKRFEDILAPIKGSMIPVKVAEKHFVGDCYVFDLTSRKS